MARFDFIAVYIMANKRNGTLYTGVTADLPARVYAHKTGEGSVFTKKYGCDQLVWFERFDTMEPALVRERRLKDWKRKWKLDLIESINPDWRDLTDDLNL